MSRPQRFCLVCRVDILAHHFTRHERSRKHLDLSASPPPEDEFSRFLRDVRVTDLSPTELMLYRKYAA